MLRSHASLFLCHIKNLLFPVSPSLKYVQTNGKSLASRSRDCSTFVYVFYMYFQPSFLRLILYCLIHRSRMKNVSAANQAVNKKLYHIGNLAIYNSLKCVISLFKMNHIDIIIQILNKNYMIHSNKSYLTFYLLQI